MDEVRPGANETFQHRHRCFEFLLNILKPYLKVNWLFCLFKIRTLVADRQQTFGRVSWEAWRNFRLAYELEGTCIIRKKFYTENSIFLNQVSTFWKIRTNVKLQILDWRKFRRVYLSSLAVLGKKKKKEQSFKTLSL